MFRKILSCLLLSLLILSCVGCGATETSPTTSDSGDGLFPVETDSALVSSDSSATDSANTAVTSEQEPSNTPDRITVEDVFAASDHYVGLTDQLNGRIIVCDLEEEDWTDDNAVVWEYKNPKFKNIAGIKFRDSEYYGEKVVLFCYPGGGVILSYETKEILFSTADIGGNPHSVELLPNGVFLVASSTDNRVDVFAPENPISNQSFDFPNAHGVLWDPEYNVLWLVGTDLLAAYTMRGTAEDPSFIPVGGMEYRTPKSAMHDLAPVYGDPTALFVTCAAGIMKFNKETETFGFSYRGGHLGKEQDYAPGTGNFEDGVFVYTTIKDGQTVHQIWNTNEVRGYIPLGDVRGKSFVRKAPNDAYYKVRVLNFDYQ
jgi:hypothetical protein